VRLSRVETLRGAFRRFTVQKLNGSSYDVKSVDARDGFHRIDRHEASRRPRR